MPGERRAPGNHRVRLDVAVHHIEADGYRGPALAGDDVAEKRSAGERR
jgi:hypothetical protein